jgi:hypothetical protein
MIRAKLIQFLGNHSERLQNWFCQNQNHVLEPTEVSPLFRVKEAKCVQCGEVIEFKAGERPGGIAH